MYILIINGLIVIDYDPDDMYFLMSVVNLLKKIIAIANDS